MNISVFQILLALAIICWLLAAIWRPDWKPLPGITNIGWLGMLFAGLAMWFMK